MSLCPFLEKKSILILILIPLSITNSVVYSLQSFWLVVLFLCTLSSNPLRMSDTAVTTCCAQLGKLTC